jgi:YhcH/YjgK/YiaL family protein
MLHFALADAARYAALHPLLPAAFAWIARHAGGDLPAGRIPIDGERLFALHDRGELQPAAERRFESHLLHADLQLPLDGPEGMEVAPVRDLPVVEEHPERDLRFHAGPAGPATRLVVMPGECAVFLPEDAHKPCCRLAGPAAFRKLVLKVRLG